MELFNTVAMIWGLPAVAYGLLLFFMSRLFPARLKLWQLVLIALLFPLGNLPKLPWGVFSPVANVVRICFVPIGFVIIPLALFRGSVWRRLAMNLSLSACQMVGEMVASAILLKVETIPSTVIFQDVLPVMWPYTLITLSIETISGIAVVFFARALQFKRLSRLYALAFLFPLSLMGVANYALLQMGVWVLVLSLLLGCGALAALMFLLGSLEEKQALEIQLQETRHAMELEQAHYQSMEEQRKRLSHIRHDFKNQLASISALLQMGEEQEARDMISSVSQTIDETRENVYCDIPVVNAVLSEKDRLCHEKGITLTVDLALPAGLTVESIHLCSIFGNLLDNAIRSAETAGAERPAVSLRSLREGDYLFLKVTNPSPPPQTPREGRGLGTQILTELAQRYGGDYQTEYKDGVFSAVVCLLV